MRRRRGHDAVARSQLRQGRLGWLLRAGGRALRLRLGLPAGGPLFATLAVTWRCNYRCTFCDLPDRARGDPPLAVLIERLALLRRRGALAVGITGGEPLLHPGLFELLAAARRLGFLVHLNSNGSRLTHAQVEPLLATGLHSINVSLDGAQPATHDALRRVPGSFEQIRATIAALLAARLRLQQASPRIGLVMAVTPTNFREVLPFARLAREWGVDAAGFLPHHPFTGEFIGGITDESTGELMGAAVASAPRRPQLAADDARALARDLDAALAEVEQVDNSPAYLAGIAPFLAGEPTATRCSAGDSHLAVDPDGRSYPCVPLMTLARSGRPLAELNGVPPRPSAADLEEVCRQCWWNCHRELDLSLKRTPVPAGCR